MLQNVKINILDIKAQELKIKNVFFSHPIVVLYKLVK